MDIKTKNKLSQIISTDLLWYKNPFVLDLLAPLLTDRKLTEDEKSLKSQVLKIFKTTNFLVGESGYNWDQWRKTPIDTVVIHHTSSSPTISLAELSILGLLRLYVPQYLKDADVLDQPIYSGHYWYNKSKTVENQTFVSYHFLIRPSGKIIQLTNTNNYLWHAGNLEVNQKSIAIAFAGKFINKDPSDKALDACKNLIKRLNIEPSKVFGHSEVINEKILGKTTSPGNTFNTWKNKII